MIQIEASHIRAGGGKVLLVDLLSFLQEKDLAATVWLTDNTLYKELQNLFFDKILIKKTTTIATLLRYCTKRSSVLFFCSLPPFVRCEKSVVYFHNLYNLWTPKKVFGSTVSIKVKIEQICYYLWILIFRDKVDEFACQTLKIQMELRRVYYLNALLLPFFRLFKKNDGVLKKYDFCYVSFPWKHKNYEGLLNAIELLSEKRDFTIAITLPHNSDTKSYIYRIDEINQKRRKNVIFNLGLLEKKSVEELYNSSKSLVFPSVLETFGLPLMEAQSAGLFILASNLEYTFDVIENPIVFNPYDYKDIANAMDNFLNKDFHNVHQGLKVTNQIERLITLLL